MEYMDAINREVVLNLGDGVTLVQMPHVIPVYGCHGLVLVPGRPPLCLRCNRVGHVQRHCRTPRCNECRRYGHTAGQCVFSYAGKLRGSVSAVDGITSEHLMDLGEVVDATGELQLGATDLPEIPGENDQPSSPHGASPTVAENVPPDISPTQPSPPAPSEVVISTTATAEEHVPGQVSEELLPVGALEEDLPSDPESDDFSHPTHGCGAPMKHPASPGAMHELPGDSYEHL